jgi:hypothetical protein
VASKRKIGPKRFPKKYRVFVESPYSKTSVGVFNTKKEANAFKTRTKKRYKEPDMKIMRDCSVYIEPLSDEETAKYHPTFEELVKRGSK